jgi:hypothetical protein
VSDSAPPKRNPHPGSIEQVVLPPLRPRAFTLPDDGSMEEARVRSSEVDEEERLPAIETPLRPISGSFSSSALDLANSQEAPDASFSPPWASKVKTDDATAHSRTTSNGIPILNEPEDDLGFEMDLDEPERMTQPAPPDYESAAQRAVDGTIPLKSSLLAPGVPSDVRPRAEPSTSLKDLVAVGDYSGALELADARLRTNPEDKEAISVRDHCRETLRQMYAARLGPLDRVPVVNMPPEQLRWMSIDQRAAFLIHHIDGMSTLEMILDVSGMPTLDAMRILTELVQQRVLVFR